jgi:hypothetical protein
MTDAKDLVEKLRFKRFTCRKHHNWYVSINEYGAAQWVHMTGEYGVSLHGYGDRTIAFTLEDGTVDHVPGPQKVSSEWLYRAIGYDVVHPPQPLPMEIQFTEYDRS